MNNKTSPGKFAFSLPFFERKFATEAFFLSLPEAFLAFDRKDCHLYNPGVVNIYDQLLATFFPRISWANF